MDYWRSSLIMLGIAAAGFAVVSMCVGWTNVPSATKALEESNLTPVQVGGVAWFACGKGDWYETKFVAKNLKGDTVTGAVCEGLLFKGQTIRFD